MLDGNSSCQKKAVKMIEKLLMTNRRELVISGIAGSGKTHLIKQITAIVIHTNKMLSNLSQDKKRIQKIHYSAVTNAAANVMNEVIGNNVAHSLCGSLGLIPLGNRHVKKGPSKISSQVPALFIIDEASFIDASLESYVSQELADNPKLKIIYFGDKAQLLPPNEPTRTIFDIPEIDQIDMITPVRQAAETELGKMCSELRNCVLDKIDFVDVLSRVNGNDIIYMDKDAFLKEAINSVKNKENSKVITYTNPDSQTYNLNIHEEVNDISNGYLAKGCVLLSNCYQIYSKVNISNAERFIVVDVIGSPFRPDPDTPIWGVYCRLARNNGDQFNALICLEGNHHIERDPLGNTGIVDARLEYSCTAYKAQGITLDVAYVDLGSLAKAKNDDTLRRLLYVAISRARKRVVFTGSF